VPTFTVTVALLALDTGTPKLSVFADRAALVLGITKVPRAASLFQTPTRVDRVTGEQVLAVAARFTRAALGVVGAHRVDRDATEQDLTAEQ